MPDPLLPSDPTQIGPYTLHARLGGGGMGQVFLGQSPGGHTVAVKVVRPDLAQDPDFRRRFAAEVAAARKVGGFYTAPVVAADTDATPPWLATAYIPGPTLHRAVTDHDPLPAASVAVLGAGLAEGLAAVHAQGVVHRDLKPANVLLAADGPRVIDFGIARALDTTSHTHSSTVLGTAAFMSPEQARAEKVGPASDVFSLGCVLAFAATGRSPFGEGAPLAVMFRLVQEEPDLTGVPEPLVGLVRTCLDKDPASRPELGEVMTLAAAAPSRSGGDESWLPPDVTEVLNRYTLAYTRVQEPRTPPATAKVPGSQKPAASGRGPAVRKDAELVIGNLSPDPLEVLIDGAEAGAVPEGGRRRFPVEAGKHTLQVDSGGRRSTVRRIEPEHKNTTRMAFDVGSQPEPVDQAVFRGSRQKGVLLLWAIPVLFVTALLAFESLRSSDGTPVVPTAVLIVGIGVSLFAFESSYQKVTLRKGGLEMRGSQMPTISWRDLAQVSLVGEGSDVQLVVWPRDGKPMQQSLSAKKDFQGGKIIYSAADIGADSPHDIERLRAALRWFADDIWVEQPTAP